LPLEKVTAAILFVFSEGCTWRGISEPGLNWNSVYKYFRRWCRDGVWQKAWESIAPNVESKNIYLDSTHIKVHRCGLNPAGGLASQAIGKTKGGWNTKLHAAVDRKGRPCSLLLTAANEADITHACTVVEGLSPKMTVADKGYDSDDFRGWLGKQNITPCIPPKSNRRHRLPFVRRSYRKRHLVENFFAKMKTFRRVATRYDKLAETYFGWVLLAVLVKFGF
jgi:transposase